MDQQELARHAAWLKFWQLKIRNMSDNDLEFNALGCTDPELKTLFETELFHRHLSDTLAEKSGGLKNNRP